MGLTNEVLQFDSRHGQEILVPKISRTALRSTQPPIQCATWPLSPQVKQLGHESDRSPPFSTGVKNEWCYISTPPYTFMEWLQTTLPYLLVFKNIYIIAVYAQLLEHYKDHLAGAKADIILEK
jgi:hypothetical protein